MDSVIYSCSYIDFTLMDGSVTLTTEHHSYELPISAQLGDSYDDNGDAEEIDLIFFMTLLMMMLTLLTLLTMTMVLVNMKLTFQHRASLLLRSQALQIQLKIFLVIEIQKDW